jgi:protein phosphatase
MTTQDWVLIVALLLVVAFAAYAMGAHGRGADRASAEPSPKPEAPPAPPKPAAVAAPAANEAPAAAPKDAPAAAPKDAPAAAPKDAPAAAPKDAPAAAPKDAPAAAPKDAPAAAPNEAPAAAPNEARAQGGPVRLSYEEDADVDTTMVGRGPAPSRAIYQPPVQRIVYDEDAEADEPTRAESLFLVSAKAQTDTGLRRKRNEDSVLVLESANLFVVADGMGGYRGGEVASQLAIKTIGDAFRNDLFEGEPHEGVPRQASELARAMQMGNAAILETAKRQSELEGMGTTVCAARFSANKKRVYIGHVGDSRCYRLRQGVFKQMTADHTMADQGVKGPEAAHLSRAVGIWPTVPIDIVMGVPLADDVYLLCSDGLTKMLNDDTIATVLRAEDDLKAAVERLILFANARGGKDNITVVLVRVVPPNWQPKPSDESFAAEGGAAAA